LLRLNTRHPIFDDDGQETDTRKKHFITPRRTGLLDQPTGNTRLENNTGDYLNHDFVNCDFALACSDSDLLQHRELSQFK
jgi:hypothetical protein